ncbi:hypothetical protein NE237_010880 [Protea cynaroides]|uniref:(+)-neomenthol dehydrogenase-like n=1 Tax=Protea cynaroides TaxID=273540 RepID=A0A9Q0R240_9MAGN|nr:hypothetical protein NE237_010880 [Protea cynaroides]
MIQSPPNFSFFISHFKGREGSDLYFTCLKNLMEEALDQRTMASKDRLALKGRLATQNRSNKSSQMMQQREDEAMICCRYRLRNLFFLISYLFGMVSRYLNYSPEVQLAKIKELARDTKEMAEDLTEALLSFLQQSDSLRIVNVSSSAGKLKNVSDTWAKEVVNDEDSLTEEKVDDVLNKYLKDFKESHGWPAYTMSKAAMNAYTRILAKKLPKFQINCVCPGYVITDITYNTGKFTVEEGAAGPVKLALLPHDGPSGLFFYQKEVSTFN